MSYNYHWFHCQSIAYTVNIWFRAIKLLTEQLAFLLIFSTNENKFTPVVGMAQCPLLRALVAKEPVLFG